MKIKLASTRYDLPQLFDALHFRIGAEVGVQHGYFSRYLLAHSSRLQTLYSIDPWQGRFAKFEADARHYLGEFGGRSVVIKAFSDNAARVLAGEGVRLDYCYIDGDHRGAAIAKDLESWLPLVRPGGILCGHDYVEAPRTAVIQVVDRFAMHRNWPLFVTGEPWATWLLFVPEN